MPLGANSLLGCHNSNNKYSETVMSQNNSKGKDNASDSSLKAKSNSDQCQMKSCADRIDDFASNVEAKSADTNINKFCKAEERFFVFKCPNGSFDRTSPFLIHKSTQALVGKPKTIKKLWFGELLVEVNNK